MPKKKLTLTVVQDAEPAEKLYWIRDTLVNGFILSVSYGGKKTYCVDYRRLNGKRATYKIGDATRYTVAEAREAAQKFLASIERGEDPTAPSNSAITLGDFINGIYEPWVLEHRKSGKLTVTMIKSSFGYLFDTPMDNITVATIEQWRMKKITV